MYDNLKRLFKDRFIFSLFKLHALFTLAFVVVGVVAWKKLPPEIPLFYSLPRSPQQLASPVSIFILPFFSLLFFAVNSIIASYIYTSQRLLSVLLVITATIATVLLLITFINIILLVL